MNRYKRKAEFCCLALRLCSEQTTYNKKFFWKKVLHSANWKCKHKSSYSGL